MGVIPRRSTIEFGKRYMELMCLLDGLFGVPESELVFFTPDPLPDKKYPKIYDDPLLEDIRTIADRIPQARKNQSSLKGQLTKKRKKVSQAFDFKSKFKSLYDLLEDIDDPIEKQIRLDELNSVKACWKFGEAQLGLRKKPRLKTLVEQITGIKGSLLLTRDVNEKQEEMAYLLKKKGFSQGSFRENIGAWRETFEVLSGQKMIEAYNMASKHIFYHILDNLPELPKKPKLEVRVAKGHAHFSALLEYYTGFRGVTTFSPKDNPSNLLNVLDSACHEIGGHYFLHVLEEKEYLERKEDYFFLMSPRYSSRACFQEGLATTISGFYFDLLLPKFGKKMDQDVEIFLAMERLDWDSLQLLHKIKLETNPSIKKKDLEAISLDYGSAKEIVKLRADSLFIHDSEGDKHMYKPFYSPGCRLFHETIKKHGYERVMKACTKYMTTNSLELVLES